MKKRKAGTEVAAYAVRRGHRARVGAVAARLGWSRSRFVREAIEQALEGFEKPLAEEGEQVSAS